MNYWKVIFATAVIFGAGVFTGGLLVNMVRQSPNHAAAHHPAPNPGNGNNGNANSNTNRLPEVLSKPFLPKLDDELHLSPDQQTNIFKIIVNARVQTRKVMQDARTDIRNVLTTNQQVRFDELLRPPARRNGGTNAVESLMWTNSPAVQPAGTNQ